MVLVKILKRKDASSVLVAVLVALVLWQPLAQETARLAGKLSGLHNNQYLSYVPPGGGWKAEYLYPVISVIVQLIVLEILGWVFVLAGGSLKQTKK